MSENPAIDDHTQSDASRVFWDAEAATFDNQPDHGLRDPAIRAAWITLLTAHLPPAPLRMLDIGCGTGSLSLILAEQGYTVIGTDFSPAMIDVARQKAQAARQSIDFQIMDAARPAFPPQQFDGIVCRHLLWALPEPQQVLKRWCDLLKPGGTLLLIEGYWHTGGGLHAADVVPLLPEAMVTPEVTPLSQHAAQWGHAVSDERYAIRARRID